MSTRRTETRSSSSHSIFGSPLSELPSQLPTRRDVARHFMFLKGDKYTGSKEILPVIAQLLFNRWNRVNIPPQFLQNIKTKLVSAAMISAFC